MGQCITVSTEELLKDNPRVCLSALRALGKCYACPVYVSTTGVPCNSRKVNADYDTLKAELFAKKKEYSEILADLEKKLKNF